MALSCLLEWVQTLRQNCQKFLPEIQHFTNVLANHLMPSNTLIEIQTFSYTKITSAIVTSQPEEIILKGLLVIGSNHMWFDPSLMFGMNPKDVSLWGPTANEICGTRGTSQAIGFMLGFCSIPLTLGPTFSGYLYDLKKDYTIAFVISGVLPILGGLLMTLIHFFQPKEYH